MQVGKVELRKRGLGSGPRLKRAEVCGEAEPRIFRGEMLRLVESN